VGSDTIGDSSVAGLERYESGPQGADDHRHRMLVNFLAALALIALIASGCWIVETLAQTGTP
jgi:hypothetical protein